MTAFRIKRPGILLFMIFFGTTFRTNQLEAKPERQLFSHGPTQTNADNLKFALKGIVLILSVCVCGKKRFFRTYFDAFV